MISTGGKGTGRAGSDNGDQIWEGVEMLREEGEGLGLCPSRDLAGSSHVVKVI